MEELLDRMLLLLWRALSRGQSVVWTQRGVANLGARRTLGLAKMWLKGQAVGKRPIFDGMCAYCWDAEVCSELVVDSISMRTGSTDAPRNVTYWIVLLIWANAIDVPPCNGLSIFGRIVYAAWNPYLCLFGVW